MHQDSYIKNQEHNDIIQQQQQEIDRLNSLIKTTPAPTYDAPYFDTFPSSSLQQNVPESNDTNIFISTLRSMQETLCNLGSLVSTSQDDIAMERITKAFKVVKSSTRYMLSGDSAMANARLSEAWEIIEYLQTRLSVPFQPTMEGGCAYGTAMTEYQTLAPLNMQAVDSNWQNSQDQSSLEGVMFPIVHVREKNANGALVCMALGCSKNSQGRTMATGFAFCRKHHNMYLIQTGQVESWSCECGNKVAISSDRCGTCHRWRRGMKPSERRLSSTDNSTTLLETMAKQFLNDDLPPPSENDPTIIMHRLKKLMEMTHLSHQLLQVRAHVHTTFWKQVYEFIMHHLLTTVYLCIPQQSQAHSETMVQSSRTRLAHLAVLDKGATFSSEETNSGGLKQGIN